MLRNPGRILTFLCILKLAASNAHSDAEKARRAAHSADALYLRFQPNQRSCAVGSRNAKRL